MHGRGAGASERVFAQRAIKTLRNLLLLREDRAASLGASEAMERAASDQSEVSAGGAPTETAEKGPDEPEQTPQTTEQPAAQRATPVVERANGALAKDPVDDEVTDLFELMEQADDLPEMDLDAFWEEATAGAGKVDGDGLSFEEAIERGLLPPELQEGLDS